MTTKLSVVLCTFNGAAHINHQVESILNQDPAVSELIIADDGSTDHTLDRLRVQLAAHGDSITPTVRWLDQTAGLGPAANFARAMGEAQDELVLLSDQDDLWKPGRVAFAIDQAACNHGAGVFASDAELIDAAGRGLGVTLFERMGVTREELAALNGPNAMRVLVRRNFIAGMTLGVRRSLLPNCLPVPAPWMHDYWLVACAAATGSLRVSAEAVVCYRQHDSNALGAGSNRVSRRIRRVLSKPNDAHSLLEMFVALQAWMKDRPEVLLSARMVVDRKVEFERRRADLAGHGWLWRAVLIAPLAWSGAYSGFASYGNWNAVRDILRAPTRPEMEHHD